MKKVITICTIFLGATSFATNFEDCQPIPINQNPAVVFNDSGLPMLNLSQPNLIAARKQGPDKYQAAYYSGGTGTFKSFDKATLVPFKGKLKPVKRVRNVLTITTKNNKPTSSTIAFKKGDTIVHKKSDYGYDTAGRCRVDKQMIYKGKNGKVEEAILVKDAALCDKIADLQKKHGKTIAACVDPLMQITNAIRDHEKTYKDMQVDFDGLGMRKVAPQIGVLNAKTGEAVALNVKSNAALMQKIAECTRDSGLGITEKPIYGKWNFTREAPAVATKSPALSVAQSKGIL